jgi:hypothetical protein
VSHDEDGSEAERPRAEDPDAYVVDEDAPKTADGRARVALEKLKELTRASVITVALCAAVVTALEAVFGGGFDVTYGFLLGAFTATTNLWLLGNGTLALLRGQKATLHMLLGFGGSFVVLVLVAGFVIFVRSSWTLGFALGLTTPALAGVWYGLRRSASP